MSRIQPNTNKNLTNLSTSTKPNLTEELHCHQLQHVGIGRDIQNPAEHDRRSKPSHRSARRKRPQHPKPSRTAATQRAPPLLVTRPKQQLALPHQKQNHSETHTHTTTTDSSCGHSQISTSQLIQIFSIFKAKLQHLGTISSRHFCKYWLHNLRCFASPDFAASNSMQLQATFWLCRWDFHSFCKQIQLQANFGYDGGVSTLYANNFNFKLHASASQAPASASCSFSLASHC